MTQVNSLTAAEMEDMCAQVAGHDSTGSAGNESVAVVESSGQKIGHCRYPCDGSCYECVMEEVQRSFDRQEEEMISRQLADMFQKGEIISRQFVDRFEEDEMINRQYDAMLEQGERNNPQETSYCGFPCDGRCQTCGDGYGFDMCDEI